MPRSCQTVAGGPQRGTRGKERRRASCSYVDSEAPTDSVIFVSSVVAKRSARVADSSAT